MPETFVLSEFVDWIIHYHPGLFNEYDPIGSRNLGQQAADKMKAGVDKTKFRQVAIELITCHNRGYRGHLNTVDVFSLVHWSYALAKGRTMETLSPIICWQRHTTLYHGNITQVALNTTNPIFITAVRRFEDSLDSHFTEMKSEFKTEKSMIEVLTSHFSASLTKKPVKAGQFAIKFEDMHLNTEELLQNVCEYS